jgi:hypothetical protein
MSDENDRTVAAILAAGLLAREASNVTPGDQERVPYGQRADHAVQIYRHCLSRLQQPKDDE